MNFNLFLCTLYRICIIIPTLIPLSQKALSSSQEETERLHRSGEEQASALRAMEEEGRRREAQVLQERARMVGAMRTEYLFVN